MSQSPTVRHLPLLKRLEHATVANIWGFCQRQPLGKAVFSHLLALKIPYSGSLGAQVDELSDGHARLTLRDRRSVRNHLDSIHAVALVNLGELSTGLAVFHAIDGRARGIVSSLRVVYHKKARGALRASCDFAVPAVDQPCELTAITEIRDVSGDVVCTVWVTWDIKPL